MKKSKFENMTFDEVMEWASENIDCITDEEELKMYAMEKLKNDDFAMAFHIINAIINAIYNNPSDTKWYRYDYSMGRLKNPDPIVNKEDVEDLIIFEDEQEEGYFEAVEICPHCEGENIYPMWDVDVNGYVAICKHCGAEIMLCDECLHSKDNLNRYCNWCATQCGGECFRGITTNKIHDKGANHECKYSNWKCYSYRFAAFDRDTDYSYAQLKEYFDICGNELIRCKKDFGNCKAGRCYYVTFGTTRKCGFIIHDDFTSLSL